MNCLLTGTQREYLSGETEYHGSDERTIRHRIRKRAGHFPGDLSLLGELPQDDIEEIVDSWPAGDIDDALAFLLSAKQLKEAKEDMDIPGGEDDAPL